jgi:Rrf2 family protein
MRRANAGVEIERAHADAPDLAVQVAAPQGSATPHAEAFPEAVLRLPLLHEIVALQDPKRARNDSRLGRRRRACPPLAAGAVAVRRLDRRLGHLEADAAAEAAAGERLLGHERQHNPGVRTTAKADYAVRAAVELAAAGEMVTADQVAQAQSIPVNFLENILRDLRRAGLVESRRGQQGGYLLARPAEEISIADVIRAVEGPLANVRGLSPDQLGYEGSAAKLRDVWVALRASVRNVLEQVTLADVARGELPSHVEELTRDADAWARR